MKCQCHNCEVKRSHWRFWVDKYFFVVSLLILLAIDIWIVYEVCRVSSSLDNSNLADRIAGLNLGLGMMAFGTGFLVAAVLVTIHQPRLHCLKKGQQTP